MAAAETAIPVWLPVTVGVAASLTVIDCVPAVLSVAVKVCDAGVAGRERVAGGQAGLHVAAAERHRAGVAGAEVAEGVLHRDRERLGHAGRGRREAGHNEGPRRGRGRDG